MLTGHDIVCISSIDWDFIWQGHQEIMSTFAKQGNRVLFIENTGVRAPNLGDLSRLRSRLRNWIRGTKGFRQEQDNLVVYSPLILPFPYSRLARWINRALLLRALRRWMHAIGFHPSIAWTFLPTPLTYDLLQALDPKLTVYYCIDDLASSSPSARRITRSEEQLFRFANLTFVTSEKLRQHALRFTDRVHLFPFGVQFEKFAQARRSADGIPAELSRLSHPLVGYVGGVHQWVDQELLAAVAERMPEANFVLVGPLQTDVSRLSRCPNVHLLGAKPHDEVPYYTKWFDVGVVPYRLSEYTAHVYPTKLNEYLAVGIPVVATDLPEIRRFNAEHGQTVEVARDAREFVRAIEEAIKGSSAALSSRRIEVAKANSWDARITQMSALIERALESQPFQTGQGWQEVLTRAYRTARHRLAKTALVLGLVYAVVFYSPLIWWVAEPLRVSETPRSADAIVVFAGGVGESGQAGQGHEERVKQAVELYQAGFAPSLIFSSGYVRVFREAEVMKALAVSLGVPPDRILLEEQATNTHENVQFTTRLLQERDWSSALLVSSPYHMRRALWTFAHAAPEITVIPVPVTTSRFYARRPGGVRVQQIQGILHEYLAILDYWWRGWL